MITSEARDEQFVKAVDLVDPGDLVCPGCGDHVIGEPPLGWAAPAGLVPEFSHRDGSVLCPDAAGRISEPVEAGGLRFALTDAGAAALMADAGAIGAGAWS